MYRFLCVSMSKQMMHKFSWVGRNCVHKVPLNCLNPRGTAEWVSDKIQRYRVYTSPTDPQSKLVHHLFYRMGAKKLGKIMNSVLLYCILYFTGCMEKSCVRYLPDAWKIMHPVIFWDCCKKCKSSELWCSPLMLHETEHWTMNSNKNFDWKSSYVQATACYRVNAVLSEDIPYMSVSVWYCGTHIHNINITVALPFALHCSLQGKIQSIKSSANLFTLIM